MIITFDKSAKQHVYNLLRPKVKNIACPFCGDPVTAKYFAGAIEYNGEPRFMHGSIIDLMAYTDYLRGKA